MSNDIRIRWTEKHGLPVGHLDAYRVEWYGVRGWEICGPDQRVWRAPCLMYNGQIVPTCDHLGQSFPKAKVKDRMRDALIAYVTALKNGATVYEEKWA